MAVYIRAAETSQASQAMAWPVSAAQFLKSSYNELKSATGYTFVSIFVLVTIFLI